MGTKENDLVFGRFAEKHLHSLTQQELLDYQAILTHNDQDLQAWVQGTRPIPNTLNQSLFQWIRDQFSV